MATKQLHLLNPRIDANFKAIFTQNTNESRNALRSFLSAAIGRKVVSVTVVENESARQFDTQRGARYDINCSFDDGTLAQIEMQCHAERELYGRRAEYYAARLVSSALNEGEDWERIPRAYQISVLDCEFDREHADFFHHYTMTDTRDGAMLSGTLNVIFLELPKLPAIDTETDMRDLPSIAKWCKFLRDADNPDEQEVISALTASEEGIMDAENTLNKISMDRWRWIIQGRIEGAERDRRSSLALAERRGREAGRNEKARENARNALSMGLTAEQAAQITSLSLEEVLSLKEELEHETGAVAQNSAGLKNG